MDVPAKWFLRTWLVAPDRFQAKVKTQSLPGEGRPIQEEDSAPRRAYVINRFVLAVG
jgi:hypothetical protein